MSGEIYVIGDSHIGLGEGDEEGVVAWLDRLAKRNPDSLYLNGDVFHYLIADDKFVTHSVEAVFAKLQELKNRGIAIHYVEGNRDFFVKGSRFDPMVSEVTQSSAIVAGKRRYLIIHGDMINDRDYPYRFWRRASKNPISRLAVRLIPKKTAKNFVDGVERKLAKTNFKHKKRLPVELMQAYGRKQKEKGFDLVVFGHFHQKVILEAGDATVVILPAWFEDGEAMIIDPETGEYRFEKV